MSYNPYVKPRDYGLKDLSLAKDGVHKLFLAYLVSIIAVIIVIAVALLAFSSVQGVYNVTVIENIVKNNSQTIVMRSAEGQALGLVAGLAIAVFMVLLLQTLLAYQGFKSLAAYDSFSYGIGFTGVKVLLGAIGLLLVSASLALVSPILFTIIITIALISALVGKILVWIALWRLSDEWNEGVVKAAVVLEIIGLIPMFSFLELIAAIMFAIGLRSIENKISWALQSGQPAQTPYGL